MTFPILAVATVAVVLSGISFGIFWNSVSSQAKTQQAATQVVEKATTNDNQRSFAAPDLTALLEQAAKLVEALTKAGLAIAALGASIVFLAIASALLATTHQEGTPA